MDPAMSPAMVHGSQTSSCLNSEAMPAGHNHMQIGDSLIKKAPCSSDGLDLSCCDSTCAPALAILASPALLVSHHTSQTQLPALRLGAVVLQTRSLYRPPIV